MREVLSYRRVLIDGRLQPNQVDAFLRRLAQLDAPRPLVFEAVSTAAGPTWLLATSESLLPAVRALIRDFIPGARLARMAEADRPESDLAGLVRLTRLPVPLDAERALEVTHALFAALGRVRGDEALSMQVVLGAPHGPHLIPRNAPDPLAGPISSLLSGASRPSQGRVRTRMETRAALNSIEVTIRLSASAGHPQRARNLVLGVFGALRLLETAGTDLRLERESIDRFDDATPALIRRSRLTTPELVPLLAYPLGDEDLPRLPVHPRRPLPPVTLETRENVFAESTAPGDARPVGISSASLLQHLVVSGPTGSGKSNLVSAVAEQLVRAHQPVMVLDPKRMMVDHLIARLPKSVIGRVVLLDISDYEHPVGFNPLDTEGRNADVVVDGILASFKAIFTDGWGPRTEDLLFAGLRSLSLAGERRGEPYTLIDLPRILSEPAFRRSVVGQLGGDRALSSYWAAFDDLSDGARAAMVAAPLNKLRQLVLRPQLVACLGQPRPRFRVRDLFREDKALLVPLNDALIGGPSAQLLGSLLVAEAFQATQERASEDHPERRPGFVIIDEAQRFVHLPTAIDDALATSRGYGVGWIAAHQYRSQMSPTLLAGFDANARSKVVYASRPKDAREYAAMSTALEAQDFESLERYELYTTLMHEGKQSPWFSARALPPKPEMGFANAIRADSRARFGADQPPTQADDEDTATPAGPTSGKKARRP